MTVTGLDIELIQALDFDYDEPCEFDRNHPVAPGCDKAAEWQTIVSCCGMAHLFCDEHKRRRVDDAPGEVFYHTLCGSNNARVMMCERIRL